VSGPVHVNLSTSVAIKFIAAFVLSVVVASCATSTATKIADSESDRTATAKEIAVQFLETSKQWKADQYRLEGHGVEDGRVVIWAVYLEDERPDPRYDSAGRQVFRYGGGESVILYIDVAQGAVVNELGFQ
jgi:hypothetical protein